MLIEPGGVFAVILLLAAFSIASRVVLGSWARRNDGGSSASARIAKMEDRIQKIEEATSGLVAEFAAVRERERFMTQLVESRARKDARAAIETPQAGASAAAPAAVEDTTNPFVVQTVSAVRRTR
jgi:hypothetical protein